MRWGRARFHLHAKQMAMRTVLFELVYPAKSLKNHINQAPFPPPIRAVLSGCSAATDRTHAT